jgi:hypothetical protein
MTDPTEGQAQEVQIIVVAFESALAFPRIHRIHRRMRSANGTQFRARIGKNITFSRTVEHDTALSIENSSRIFPNAQGNLDGIHQLRAREWLDQECYWTSTQGMSSGPVAGVRRNQNYRKSAAGSF